MYEYHYDHAFQNWHVFGIMNGYWSYVCSFDTAKEAQAFCESANRKVEVLDAAAN